MTGYPTDAIGSRLAPACVDVMLPVRTVSESNVREHWSKRAIRAAKARGCAKLALWSRLTGLVRPGRCMAVLVILTRYAPSSGLDDDNLRGALKATRDGVADALGLDDGDVRIAWEYGQEDSRKLVKGTPRRAACARGYGVRVQVLRRA